MRPSYRSEKMHFIKLEGSDHFKLGNFLYYNKSLFGRKLCFYEDGTFKKIIAIKERNPDGTEGYEVDLDMTRANILIRFLGLKKMTRIYYKEGEN